MSGCGASQYPHMFRAGLPLDELIEESGILRVDKLRELTEKPVVEQVEWRLNDCCNTALIRLKWAFVYYLKEHYYDELYMANLEKKGRPYDYPPMLMALARIIMDVEGLTLRQVAEELQHLLSPEMDIKISYTTLCRRLGKIDLSEYLKNNLGQLGLEQIIAAVDTTGLSPNWRGKWLEKKHGMGTRKRASWIKFGILVSVSGHIPLSFVVVNDSVADVKTLKPLLIQAKKHGFKIIKVAADKAYDARYIYEYLLAEGILPAILPRKGGSTKSRGSPYRAELVMFMNNYSERALKDLLGIKDRLAVERFYAIFKAMFSEKIRSRKKSHIINEIRNKFILIQYYLALRYLVMSHLIESNW